MKIKFGIVLFTATALLAGCKGFWDAPSSTSTTTTTKTTLSSGVFYVLNQTTKQIAAYSIVSGTLEPVSGSPYTLAATPFCIAVAPNSTQSGGFLYVGTDAGIYLYDIESGGGLTAGNSGGTISSDIPAAMQVYGSWLVDAFLPNSTGTSVQIDAIPINATTGLYAGAGGAPPSQTFNNLTNAAVKQMVISPDGDNVFLALSGGGTLIDPFTAGNSNPLGGTARPIGVSGSEQALSVAVDPTSRLFYIGETNADSTGTSGALLVYSYSSLANPPLTQISGSPIASGGLAPSAILPIASGEYVYVANGQGDTGSGNIAWFPITASGTTYTVAAGNDITGGIEPNGLAEDSDDNFVLAVSTGGSTSSGDPDLEAFTMSSGTLTAALTSTTGTDPVGAIAIAALP
jgi:hypothetical protein